MYVREAARGRGLGQLLIEHVLHDARRSARVEFVNLTVSESNPRAIALYARCGFVRFGTEPMAVKLGEQYVAKVHMWQRISPGEN
jgi:ribosomal protein S18 acetylase RimI-like enzyme